MTDSSETRGFFGSTTHTLSLILAGAPVDGANLSPAFGSAGLDALRDRLVAQHGAFMAILDVHGSAVARFERSEVPVEFGVDTLGRLAGFSLGPATRLATTFQEEVDRITQLPGEVGLLIDTDGKARARYRSDMPMPVGSAFKIAVLAAVARAVDMGRLSWEQNIFTTSGLRSLPTGILQEWPSGIPLSIMTLACLMISRSDNTATDMLIAAVGREAVEALSPRNAPFLTTREAFILKATAQAQLRNKWLNTDQAGRRELLPGVAEIELPRARDLSPDLAPSIEWFFTAQEIAELLSETADLAPYKINPGPAPRGLWANVAYKGGGEATLVNSSFHLTDHSGTTHRLVATLATDGLCDPELLLDPVRAIVRLLRDGEDGSGPQAS